VPDLVLDPARSRVRLQTFAEGLLARLAHDLELICGDLSGTASTTGNGGALSGNASVDAPLSGMHVAGVLGKDGRVDERGLSTNERRDCLAKMQKDVFHARPDGIVRIHVNLDGDSARIRVVPPNGKAVEAVVPAEIRTEDNGLRASGSFDVSLVAIGSDVVKGPMGAFRVKDRVKVIFDVAFRQPA
jgi:hypothetical protein